MNYRAKARVEGTMSRSQELTRLERRLLRDAIRVKLYSIKVLLKPGRMSLDERSAVRLEKGTLMNLHERLK